MTDRLITHEQAADHVRRHCLNPHDVSTYGERPGTTLLCGCGGCPDPDPTPEQFRQRVEGALWRAAARAEYQR